MSDHSARPVGSIPPVHAGAPHRPASDPRRWWALVLLCLTQFMVILDITVVNVALPSIGSDLQLDRTSLTWVVTAYTLCFGGLLLLGGRLADTLGRRRIFLAGLGVFTVASLASGLAQAGTVLVAARAGQGVGAALLSPAALAIITTTFEGAERNRALGVWAAIAGAGAAVGVLAGGLLVQYASWRWVFFINLPVGILLAAAAPSLIAAVRPAHRARRLDLLGALAGTLATAAIIYGLVSAGSDGWGATTTLLWLAAGLVLAGGFVAVERTAREPLVPMGLLVRWPLLAGQLVMLASSGLLLATTGLGAGFVVATTPMAHVDQAQAGMTSGLLSTGHELGASLGVAVVSTIAAASLTSDPLAGRPPVRGFDRAFLACAVIASVAAVAAAWLPPPGRPPPPTGPASPPDQRPTRARREEHP